MKIKYLLIVALCSFGFRALAQREVQYNQYLVNPMAINPALTGMRQDFHLNAVFRRQWLAGVQGLPTSQTYAMDGALGQDIEEKQGFIGLGVQGLLDRTGSSFRNSAVFASMAYHYKIDEDKAISVGVLGGVNVLPIYDASSQQGINKAKGSLGAGINFDAESFWLGVSMPEILGQSLAITSQNSFSFEQPKFINAGLKLYPTEDLIIKPSVLLRLSKGTGFDVNAQANYQNKYGVALSYRKSASSYSAGTSYVYGLITYNLSKNIMVGYSYSSKAIEAYLNDRSIHELMFTFIPNPTK